MLFNSLTFALFFAGVMFLHHLPLSWRMRKINLLWASYLFYMAWNPPFVIMLIASSVLDWFCGIGLTKYQGKTARRLILIASLVGNLGKWETRYFHGIRFGLYP